MNGLPPTQTVRGGVVGMEGGDTRGAGAGGGPARHTPGAAVPRPWCGPRGPGMHAAARGGGGGSARGTATGAEVAVPFKQNETSFIANPGEAPASSFSFFY